MATRIQQGGLQVDSTLHTLINQQIIPGTGVDADHFWQSFEAILNDLTPKNKALLEKRAQLQQQINQWHKARLGQTLNFAEYKSFLAEIGYLVPVGEDFSISTQNIEPEIAEQAGPQLVVPIMNARFALNAANARWGSLYDALYGTDVIPDEGELAKTSSFNALRADEVRRLAKEFLDSAAPLNGASHKDAADYSINNGKLNVRLKDGETVTLVDNSQLQGYQGEANKPDIVLLKHNNLHFEIEIDQKLSRSVDAAGVIDVNLEAALSTIMDCEDSVAAVDGEDKALAYSNWLGLMKGDLAVTIKKGQQESVRRLNPDRSYTSPKGKKLKLKGRSLLFIRNVGHLMTTPAILDSQGHEIPEGIMDGMVTSLIAIHDLKGNGPLQNSRANSINIVKPKMHGPEEVAFTNELFARIEDALGLTRNTIKVGIMDEERRTSVNLKECIRAAKERVVFINTGFLDRTGDEIHTSMEAGPMVPKADMKAQKWISAYEDSNVDIGLACGLQGKSQIGKGMWAEPDSMAKMMQAKIAHPMSGANTAWVPSPTAATLHAMHYHQVDVQSQQQQIKQRTAANVDDILTIPLLGDRKLSDAEIQRELDNNAQGILGYVVRWVDQGVGCSKVPDINNVGLMEDRATLRISSQHIANWLHHGICSQEQVMATLKRMAAIVDSQNAGDPAYINMAPNFDGIAFQAACDLVFKGCEQPSGYTEPVLHAKRLALKAAANT
ncbi:malate synthase G [Dasania sp. GY-MA-18]|uniref:Malate synthase G n=1 Tax=Dasania phycosphaerae TaxID=2950436 RepID=A0A9J6RI70_9GAMM|nr:MULTISPECIES: malate synthase G [Dasania]MCR8921257.1 malate synthase G [Dasania sp. GY-MA-18]MCZ0863685.1 malate synthase G [Dasania phycosphaerae]MCZ0867413.1 malate synthase G [Dasania phycosphaerae]